MNTGRMTVSRVLQGTKKIAAAALLVYAALLPFLAVSGANASQLTNRFQSVTSAAPSATSVSYTFQFRLPSSTAIQAMEFQFCTSPIGQCNGTAGTTIPTISGGAYGSINANWTNSTAFGSYTVTTNNSGGGSATNNQIQVTRTQAASESQSGSNDRSVTFTGMTNPSTANNSYYVRMRLYSDSSATTLVHDGAVAQATSQTLTINARVQEVLQFCVGRTTVDDATTSVAGDCSSMSGTSVDLGIIDSAGVNVTPVSSTYGGDGYNGAAMVRTNAQNGVTIDYYSGQDTSSGKLKVAGASCSGTSVTDQCFNSSGTTQSTLVEGTEEFGMTISGINCGSTTAYTCTFGSGTYNLTRDANYDGDDSNTYTAEAGYNAGSPTYTTTNKFAWEDTTSADRIASSTTVVDDETMILKFAATAASTTPTGAYLATASFVATPTF